MDGLLRSKNSGGGKAMDLVRLLVAEAALEVRSSLLGLFVVMLSLQNEIFTSGGEHDFINRILGKNETVLENKDDGESDDDNDEGDDEDAENQYDDDGGNDEDASEEEGNDEDDDPEANGEGGSDKENGEEDQEDEEEDQEDEEEDEEDEDDDEEEDNDEEDDVPQPPAKKRK